MIDVKEFITKLLEQFAPTIDNTTSVTWDASVADASKTCRILKMGDNLVYIMFACNFNDSVTGYIPQNTTFATLAEEARPATDIAMPCNVIRGNPGSNTAVAATCTIGADGTIKCNVSSIMRGIVFSGVFLTV